MSLGMTYSPKSLGKGLQITNFEQCLHTVMVIEKCTDVFRGFYFRFGGLGPWRNISRGKRNSMKKAKDFLALLEKINMKKFFQLEVRSSIKT